GETPTQRLPAPPPPEEIPRETTHPVPPPLLSDQELRGVVHLLTQYAPSIVATMQDRIHRFIAGLAPELTEACATAVLQDSMDISRIQEFAQNIERGRRSSIRGATGPSTSIDHLDLDHLSYRGTGMTAILSQDQIGPFQPQCTICGRRHLGQCRAGSDACYTYGRPGHMMRDCPNKDSGDMAQPANSVTGSAMSVHPSGHESRSSAGRG
uniref:Uncharacterized protein LOC104221953 n=1 Tax=Nicotiana sylvestris TaxID=4096 RepID=A0A1U7W2I1_NICSY